MTVRILLGEDELLPAKRLAETLRSIIASESSQTVLIQSASAEVAPEDLLCPLTLDLSEQLNFSHQALFDRCREILSLRQWVQSQFKVATGDGILWLPIVHTAKGPLFAEAIGQATPQATNSYVQPVHLSDRQRQPLYRFGRQLLDELAAPPAVYLLQFGLTESQIITFDRLFPFPAAPALASVGVQSPDLLTCHWRCLTRQPITDLLIANVPFYEASSVEEGIGNRE